MLFCHAIVEKLVRFRANVAMQPGVGMKQTYTYTTLCPGLDWDFSKETLSVTWKPALIPRQ